MARGNLHLLPLFLCNTGSVEDDQPARADQRGNPEKDSDGGKFPGRAIGPNACGSKLAAHRLDEVGDPGIHGHGTTLCYGAVLG